MNILSFVIKRSAIAAHQEKVIFATAFRRQVCGFALISTTIILPPVTMTDTQKHSTNIATFMHQSKHLTYILASPLLLVTCDSSLEFIIDILKHIAE